MDSRRRLGKHRGWGGTAQCCDRTTRGPPAAQEPSQRSTAQRGPAARRSALGNGLSGHQEGGWPPGGRAPRGAGHWAQAEVGAQIAAVPRWASEWAALRNPGKWQQGAPGADGAEAGAPQADRHWDGGAGLGTGPQQAGVGRATCEVGGLKLGPRMGCSPNLWPQRSHLGRPCRKPDLWSQVPPLCLSPPHTPCPRGIQKTPGCLAHSAWALRVGEGSPRPTPRGPGLAWKQQQD